MKKHLRILLFSGLAMNLDLIAQPTLTATGINPVVGITINNDGGNYVSPGSAGASQTWDLSTMTSGSPSSTTFSSPSSTPNAASFPTANVCVATAPQYAYYKTSSTAWQNLGVVSGSGVIMSYSNAEDLLRFPFTFNDTYSDPWATTFVSGGTTFYRTGTTTVTADGYGTLITPAGTFSNVLRVHFFQDYQDSADIGGFPYIIDYQNDEYMWYLNGNHNPIALVFTLTTSLGSPFTAGSYMTGVMGVNENKALVSYELFPNPSSDDLKINIGLKEKQKVEIKLFSTLGTEVMQPVSGDGFQGENSYSLNVQNLPEGFYFAEVRLNGLPASTRRFSVCR